MANKGVHLVLDWEGDVYKDTTYSYIDFNFWHKTDIQPSEPISFKLRDS